jgi:hypothetical protein
MKSECVGVDQIGAVLELPEDNPVRRHVERCPRCASVLAAYLAFVEAQPAAGADTADAEARLMGFLRDRIGSAATIPPATERRPGGIGFFGRLRAAVNARPAWVAAALVVLVAGVVWWRPWVVDKPALRSVASLPLLKMHPPQTLSNGAVRLGWESKEAAGAYRIVLYNQELEEIARLDAGAATTFDLVRDKLPPDTPAVVICRVAALQNGDEIAETAPIAVELP